MPPIHGRRHRAIGHLSADGRNETHSPRTVTGDFCLIARYSPRQSGRAANRSAVVLEDVADRNSYNGLRTYGGDQTDLAWFQSLRP